MKKFKISTYVLAFRRGQLNITFLCYCFSTGERAVSSIHALNELFPRLISVCLRLDLWEALAACPLSLAPSKVICFPFHYAIFVVWFGLCRVL